MLLYLKYWLLVEIMNILGIVQYDIKFKGIYVGHVILLLDSINLYIQFKKPWKTTINYGNTWKYKNMAKAGN